MSPRAPTPTSPALPASPSSVTSITLDTRAASALLSLDVRSWRADLLARLSSGARIVTLYGRPGPAAAGGAAQVVVTAVVQTSEGRLEVTRTVMDGARGYHAMTADVTALHCFERELHEQLGVRIAGHPWLKPIRFQAGGRAERDAYPFYSIEGKEVHEVAVGPIHAGVIEPGSFRFMCLGEVVHHLEIHLGYQHRGVEPLLLKRDPRKLAPLVETIAGDSSIAHGWAYAAAIEALAETEPAAELEVARGVMLELERVAMHLAGLSGLATDVGFLQGASSYGRLRTTAINTSMRLCGSRFGRGALRPGGSGVRLEATPAASGTAGLSHAELRQNLALLVHDLAIINDCFLAARTVQHRLMGVGRLTAHQATDLGLVGPAARASGLSLDQRAFGAGVYGKHPVTVVSEPSGDCWARARMRIGEIERSLAWIASVLEGEPVFAPRRSSLGPLGAERLAVSVVEGWRGEVVHCLETDAEGALLHYKVQDPSLRNWLGLAIAVRENEISDFPICNKSFDLSYCGNDL
jgi:Ni,Fe-hydrogenase III large subunit